MRFIRRAWLNICRKKIKSLLLFTILFLLGVFLTGALSVHQFIVQSESNLRAQVPPIATLEHRNSQMGIGEIRFPTIEMIEAVGNLTNVISYDMTAVVDLLARDLQWVLPDLTGTELGETVEYFGLIRFRGNGATGGRIEQHRATGVSTPLHPHLESGLISIVEGRFFSQDELDQAAPVVVAPRLWADANNLEVGSSFVLESFFPDSEAMSDQGILDFYRYWHDETFYLFHEVMELEIIGLFEIEKEFPSEMDEMGRLNALLMQQDILYNQFYLPFLLQYEFALNARSQLPERAIFSDDLTLESVFLLDDARNFRSFATEAAQILPEGWEVLDSSGGLGPIFIVLDNMLVFSDYLYWGAILATILILGLMTLFYLIERKHEIGLYLSLGEKKKTIILQFLLEILIPGLLAASAALVIGQWFSSLLSSSLLEQQLLVQLENNVVPFSHAVPWSLQLFNPGLMSLDEMMTAFDTSLTTSHILMFFGIQIITIIVSVLIPALYVLRLTPKKILL